MDIKKVFYKCFLYMSLYLELEFLFEAQGAISTVGEHLVNPDCLSTDTSAAELYYSKQQFFAAMPFMIALVSFVIWYAYGKANNRPFFKKRVDRKKETTTKDKFVVTLMTILYLLYPTLCKNAFGLFDCKKIGGELYLKVDLEEPCYEGRHWGMMLGFGVGQLLMYAIGLPLVVLLFLRHNRASLNSHVTQVRFGLFFSGYKPARFFWETVITIRKVSVVMLAVFGAELGPEKQAQVAILLLMICIVFEIYGQPYLEKTERYKILGKLEISSLLIEFCTMWSGLMLFSLDDSKPSDKVAGVALTIVVIIVNTGLLIWFAVQFVRAKLYEREQAKLAAAIRIGKNKKSFMQILFGGSTKEKNIEMSNPMEKNSVNKALKQQERKKKMQKVRKKLSIGAKNARNVAEATAKNNKARRKSFIKIENEDGGDDYFQNVETGETMWEMPEDGELLSI